ncbi:hypothetical protein FGO68_gene685 [Halteria grandinella]|uniref:Uncharacterized protein n=1 Tax=Halteria grandinella TaxID=5974 RepID=A0A8J8NJR8_HALGN|nr:hypothetical protein FGO68_gene685 [Halteria grandinella]
MVPIPSALPLLPMYRFHLGSTRNILPDSETKSDNTIVLTFTACSDDHTPEAWTLFNEAIHIQGIIDYFTSHKVKTFDLITKDIKMITQKLLTEINGKEETYRQMRVELQDAASEINERTRMVNEFIKNFQEQEYPEELVTEYEQLKGMKDTILQQNQKCKLMIIPLLSEKQDIENQLSVLLEIAERKSFELVEWDDKLFD